VYKAVQLYRAALYAGLALFEIIERYFSGVKSSSYDMLLNFGFRWWQTYKLLAIPDSSILAYGVKFLASEMLRRQLIEDPPKGALILLPSALAMPPLLGALPSKYFSLHNWQVSYDWKWYNRVCYFWQQIYTTAYSLLLSGVFGFLTEQPNCNNMIWSWDLFIVYI